MARRVLTDLTVSGDLTVDGYLDYSDLNTTTSSSSVPDYSDLKVNPVGYLLINVGGTEYKVPYYNT
jgi:hypothetical protein